MKLPQVSSYQEEIQFLFFIPCFTVSPVPSISRHDFYSNSTILIISLIYSFIINKFNPLPAITAPCPVIFLENLFNTEEVALIANLGKTTLPNGTERSDNTFLSRFPDVLPGIPSD